MRNSRTKIYFTQVVVAVSENNSCSNSSSISSSNLHAPVLKIGWNIVFPSLFLSVYHQTLTSYFSISKRMNLKEDL